MPYVYETVTVPVIKRPLKVRILSWIIVGGFVSCLVLALYPFIPHLVYRAAEISPIELPVTRTIKSVQAEAALAQPLTTTNYLLIPKIGVKAEIVQGADLSILNKKEGVWNQVGSIDQGNYVLAGHRFQYVPPNSATLYNLDKMDLSEEIIVWNKGQRYVYQVSQKFIVEPSAIHILDNTPERQLTIYTCEDIYARHRLVIIAKPQINQTDSTL